MSLFAQLQDAAAPLRARVLSHPFVRGLSDGTLPEDRFQFYLRQDYVFLIHYCRVLALAAARAPDLGVAARLADLLVQTLNTEMDLHRQCAWKAGIAPEALDDTEPAPTTVAYTNHLRVAAETGDLAAILAAILPCAHGYWEIATALRARDGWDRHPLYADWIRLYTTEEYGAFAAWAAELLDRMAPDPPADRVAALREIYLQSQRYEYLFWEMSDRMEGWPI
ncbi:MAG TPA: thiaminase II [bacterium]|nr:thiaminase II [bacterium]